MLQLVEDPTIPAFIEHAVTPFLFGHAYHAQTERMPFGELAHGGPGLVDDLLQIFGLPRDTRAETFLTLAGMKRRHANKRPCPCASGLRVGRCHRAAVHAARTQLGRARCREQAALHRSQPL